MDLLNKFKEYNEKKEIIRQGDNLLLGVSGGPDSLTMLDLFFRLKNEYDLEISVFHLNHCFREEADNEAEFVEKKANFYGLDCYIEIVDVPALAKKESLSPEQAARQARFNLLKETADKVKADKIALAHNRDDQVETVFLHMLRGSGISGLKGINPLSRIDSYLFIHPLLNIYRSEIEKYCKQQNLKPRHDPTNQETDYTRNKIRHDLLPYIEREINSGVKGVISQMADIIRGEDDLLNQLAGDKFNKLIQKRDSKFLILSLPQLKELHPALLRRVLRYSIYKLKKIPADIYFQHIRDLEWLVNLGETGKRIDLPDNITVLRSYDSIIIKKGNFSLGTGMQIKFEQKLNKNDMVVLPDQRIVSCQVEEVEFNWERAIKPNICYFDLSKVDFPLKIRNRRPGDRFKPLGMAGFKKVKDFMIDEKIPLSKRDNIPIVQDQSNKIIWLAGLRMDDRVKIMDSTIEIGKLHYQKEGDLK